MRDLKKRPYSKDEKRVAKWWCEKGVGGGDDPIGSLIASHESLARQRNDLLFKLKASSLPAPSEARGGREEK